MPNIEMKGDSMCALSSIPCRIIIIHNVRSCYMCKISGVGDYEIHMAYEKLCDGRIMKE